MEALFRSFKMRAESVSAEVYRFAARSEALAFLSQFLAQEETAGPAVWADGPLVDRAEIPGLAQTVTRKTAAAAKAGISQMDWAIADTGTLVQNSTAIDRRLVSTLPPIHIAIVPTGSLQPDLPTLLTKLHPNQMSYISMITGPSRTADIERVLTIGVHGPARLVILFVDDLGRN